MVAARQRPPVRRDRGVTVELAIRIIWETFSSAIFPVS